MERVIFDTNAYRYLVKDIAFNDIDNVVAKLRAKEQQRGIQALTSPIVVKELLAHVASKSDPSYNKCLNATKALYLHSGDADAYHLLASPEMLIAKSFFNEVIPAKEETNKALMQIAYHIAMNPSNYVFTKFQRNLNLNRDHVLDSENFFAVSLQQWVKAIDPTSTGWRVFANDEKSRRNVLGQIRSIESSLNLAAGLITVVYDLLRTSGSVVSIDYDELYDMSQIFIEKFPEYIALYKFVFENLVNSDFNVLENSRSNFLWDIQLMLNIGDHTIEGDKLYFVTSDKAIISNAIEHNAKYSILTFQEYQDYIN